MKNKIKYIDIVFENCEVAKVKPDMFIGLVVRGITLEYMVNCFQYKDGEVCDYLTCEFFEIDIKRGLKSKPFGYTNQTLEERITAHRDITHVDIFFEDGSNKYISVPWDGGDWENENQKTKVSKEYIHIKITK